MRKHETRLCAPSSHLTIVAPDKGAKDSPRLRRVLLFDSFAGELGRYTTPLVSSTVLKLRESIIAGLAGLLVVAAVLFLVRAKREHPSALLDAATRGDSLAVVRYLGEGTSMEYRDGWRTSALDYASGNGRTSVVRLLLARGARVNDAGRLSRTPLMAAAHGGHDSVVTILLQHGARLDLHDAEGHTAADLARAGGDAALGQLLSDAGHRP